MYLITNQSSIKSKAVHKTSKLFIILKLKINDLFQPFTMRYVDSLLVVITAINNFIKDQHNFTSPNYSRGLCGIQAVKPWVNGAKLLEYILSVSISILLVTAALSTDSIIEINVCCYEIYINQHQN